jgi:fatty acid desaturase
MYLNKQTNEHELLGIRTGLVHDPRVAMAKNLPAWLQPFLTWLTAKPAPGEIHRNKSSTDYIFQAIGLVVGGCIVSSLAVIYSNVHSFVFWLGSIVGTSATTSGLGVFQVVIFHHCAHNTVFRTRKRNRRVGRLISALLLFKHFDRYQYEHMLHHNADKLFTPDDEFMHFMVGLCHFTADASPKRLWRRLLLLLISPAFHARFLWNRLKGSLASHDWQHNLIGYAAVFPLAILCAITHRLELVSIAWFLPLTIMLQVATVFRILCEHRLPAREVIESRGRELVCRATAGVFAGSTPPASSLRTLPSLGAWTGWWCNILLVQLPVRVLVLVGDAPCHDFHHRRPGKKWTSYTHARQADLDAGSPGFPLNYVDTWGLFRAIDENFAAISRAPAALFVHSKIDLTI